MTTKTIYFLIDCSGSMHGARADAVNLAMQKIVREAMPKIKKEKNADLCLRFAVLGFSDNFSGKVVEIVPKTEIESFNTWTDIDARMFQGGTPTGAALQAVIDDMKGGCYGDSDPCAGVSAIILISDGLPNGDNPTYDEVLRCADRADSKYERCFYKAQRIALGINVDETGRASLKRFAAISSKLEAEGLQPYYDCSEQYVDKFVEIMKSIAIKTSQA